MSEKPRKFTNGYYPSVNCDDKNDIENSSSDNSLMFEKHNGESVYEKTNRLETKWNQLHKQEKHKNKNSNLIKSIIQGEEYTTDINLNQYRIVQMLIRKLATWKTGWKKMMRK